MVPGWREGNAVHCVVDHTADDARLYDLAVVHERQLHQLFREHRILVVRKLRVIEEPIRVARPADRQLRAALAHAGPGWCPTPRRP